MSYLVHNMLQASADQYPAGEAIIDSETRLDYRTTLHRVSALSGALKNLGVSRGDRVAIFLPPNAQLPIAINSVSMANAVFVPVHHGLFPGQVAHILKDCGATGLITDASRLIRLSHTLPELNTLRFAIVDGDVSELPNVQAFSLYEYQRLIEQQLPCPPQICIENDLAAILYTSGSTGRPKGVMLSHANVIAGAEIVADYLNISSEDRLLAALPFSFDAGLNQLTTALFKGATIVMTQFRFGRDIVKKLYEEQITGLAGVPSLWSLLAQPSSGLGKHPLPDFRYITNTGGAMPQNVLEQLKDCLPDVNVFLMYGLTEAFRSTYLPPTELDRRPTSMGKAIPNTEIMVINEEGQRCKPGEIGELVHHGPTVSLGYWGHPDLTASILRPHPFPPDCRHQPDLVCYSGDLVKMDEDGFLYFIGRRDNQIKSAGFRISPTEVEEVICRVAPIRQAAVIGIPDPMLGQTLVAYAIRAESAPSSLVPAEILVNCAAELPRHMVPKRILLVDRLPETSSGKVNYPELRRLEMSRNDVKDKKPDTTGMDRK